MSDVSIDPAALLAAIVQSSEDAIISKDLNSVVTSWNKAAERLFGYTSEEMVGSSILRLIPADRTNEEETVLERIRAGERVAQFETVRCRKDGLCVPVALTISPIRDRTGRITGASKIVRDISTQKRAEMELQRAARQASFLARLSAALAHSMDYDATLKSVPGLAVPDIADWCAVDILRDDGTIQRLAVAHADAESIELATEVRRRYEDPMSTYSVPYVIENGMPAFVREITDDMIRASAAGDEERIRLVRSLGLRSYVCVPLMIRSRVVGALTLATAESGRLYSDDDVQFAEDIASRVAMAVENARTHDELRNANRVKDDFLATLSHELRTPLNAILGYSRMLRGGILTTDKVAGALETIERNTRVLTQMVEDVLDVSRIVAGKVRLNVQPVELPELIHEALATVRPAADAKRIRIDAVIDPSDAVVSGDPGRLLQVLSNLLSNAVKFTPRNGAVRVRLERVNSSVEVVVSDTGIGIHPDLLPYIFERFRQGDSGTNRQRGGLGLGLAISRNLVEMHGGSIEATSEGEGKGASFHVRLPLLVVQPHGDVEEKRVHPRQEQAPALSPLANLSGTHVLAVDNDDEALQLVQEILQAASARVTVASSGQRALDLLQTERPDVVLADVGMPTMDGYEFIQTLRRAADPAIRDIPAAALTAYARSEDRVKALQDGFQMHLSKPIDPVELVAAVRALARRH